MSVLDARFGCPLHDAFDLVVGQARNDGGYADDDGNAGAAERANRVEPPCRRRGPRLHVSSELTVERRNRDHHDRKPAFCQRRKKIDIADDQVVLSGDAKRVLELGEGLDHCARD